jgi:hypothetical protein
MTIIISSGPPLEQLAMRTIVLIVLAVMTASFVPQTAHAGKKEHPKLQEHAHQKRMKRACKAGAKHHLFHHHAK